MRTRGRHVSAWGRGAAMWRSISVSIFLVYTPVPFWNMLLKTRYTWWLHFGVHTPSTPAQTPLNVANFPNCFLNSCASNCSERQLGGLEDTSVLVIARLCTIIHMQNESFMTKGTSCTKTDLFPYCLNFLCTCIKCMRGKPDCIHKPLCICYITRLWYVTQCLHCVITGYLN